MTESLALIPRSIDEVSSLAEKLAKSTLIPEAMREKMPNVLVTILAGQELGLAPMAALRSIHVIEGKPVLSADTMVAVVLGSGKAEYFTRVAEGLESVTYETLRVGAKEPRRCTWTKDMAKAAGLHLKDNWRAYLRAMLASRAKSELARDVYPDVLAGCYSHDEARDGGWDEGRASAPATVHTDVADAEIVSDSADARKPLPWWIVAIDSAETEEQLKALSERLAELKGADKAEAKKRYGARLAVVRKGGAVPATVPEAPAEQPPTPSDAPPAGDAS
jgi:hypothetical protein